MAMPEMQLSAKDNKERRRVILSVDENITLNYVYKKFKSLTYLETNKIRFKHVLGISRKCSHFAFGKKKKKKKKKKREKHTRQIARFHFSLASLHK